MLFGKNINRYYGKYIYLFLLGIASLIAVDFFQLEIPNIIGQIIDGIKTATIDLTVMKGFILSLLKIIIIMFAGRFLWRVCIFGMAILVETDLRKRMFLHAEKLSQTYYQKNKVGALMALFTNDIMTIKNSFGRGTIMVIDVLFLGVLAFMKMWKMDPVLTLISAIPLVLLAITSGLIGKFMRIRFKERQEAYANLSDVAQESFSGLSVIRAFVKEAKEVLYFARINKDYMDKNLRFVKAHMLLHTIIELLISFVVVIIVGYGGYLIFIDAGFTIGTITEYIAYFGTLTWPMLAISQLINLLSQAKASLKRVNDFLDEKVDITDNKDIIRHPEVEGAIEFNHLHFTYPGSNQEVLHDIHFSIKKGESVGILGRTGSGKTTLVDLLLRIYNVEKDEIYIDGMDLMSIPYTALRQAIAYVPQDNFLFSDTIAANIAFSLEKVDAALVQEAARLADVDENIRDFTHQYETILGERGVTVSGGQKQRLSIARALLKDAPILILDDSVSAVDTKTEETILHHLKQTRKNKTTILIAHRISTVKQLDKIVLLDEGRIIGVGSHEKLLADSPVYQKMVEMQKLEEEVEGLL